MPTVKSTAQTLGLLSALTLSTLSFSAMASRRRDGSAPAPTARPTPMAW